jgi:hypothetical protein
MYELSLLYRKLEDARDALPDDETAEESEEILSTLIADLEPDSSMVCKFCSEPFSDWFERTLHYDTCQSIARNRRKNPVDTHPSTDAR